MRSIRAAIALLVFGLLCLGVVANAAPAPTARRIVVFNAAVPQASRVAQATAAGGKLVRELPLIDAVVIELPTGGMQAAEARLRKNSAIVRVDESPRVNWLLTAAAPAIPSFISRRVADTQPPQGQEKPWGILRVNAPAAWSVTKGAGVKVAVIDTGIDAAHPNLKANLKGGWNAITKTADYNDDNGHGTHCAGTVAAAEGDAGVVGVAPQAELYGVKVLDADGSGTFDDVIAGMQWAVDNKMQIASMSLGASKGNPSLLAAVEAMKKAGVALIAAAGNSGRAVGFPAAYPGAIAVAALDAKDKVAYFSSRGPEVALIAPGVDVRSTYKEGGYDTLSGTSMATPHVSGLAALAIAAKGLSGYDAVKAALTAAAAPLKDVPATQQGAGVVDAAALVK
jgi:subtilisin family serine protease